MRREISVVRGQAGGGGFGDEPFAWATVRDQIIDGDEGQAMAAREFLELGSTRHRAVIVHNFAEHAGGLEARELCEIHGSFRVAGPREYAGRIRAKRENVTGPRKTFGG